MQTERLAEEFRKRFGRRCDVIARAPGRVNLIGEHTDYNDGFVLPMALEHSTWAACAQRQDDRVYVASEALRQSDEWIAGGWTSDHPHWTSYIAGVAALLLRQGARLGGFDMLISSDVPVGSGLSSSAALEVSAAKALVMLAGEAMDSAELADLCRRAEHEFAKVPCGIMDQFVSLLAREDHALLLDCRSRSPEYVPLPLKDYVVLIVHSGVKHELASGEYAARQRQCQAAVEYFRRVDPAVRALRDVTVAMVRSHASQMDPLAAARALHVTTENQRTLDAAAALKRGDLPAMGRLMAESHRSLRDDYEVSSPELDRLVEIAAGTPGVVGSRMTGGGFGGCIVAIVRQDALGELTNRVERDYSRRGPHRATLITSRPGRGASIELA